MTNLKYSILTAAVISIIGILIILVMLFVINNAIYPGCTVIEQNGDVLTIELNDDLFNGSDEGNCRTSLLIYNICFDGYKVKVWGRIIDLDEAKRLISIYGSPGCE